MHVLEVIHGLASGGAESAMIRRLRYQPADIRTTVLCITPVPKASRSALLASGVRVIERDLSWADARWLRNLCAASDVEVVVSHAPRETLKLLVWQRRGSAPLVVIAHAELVSDDAGLRHVKAAALRVLNRRAQLHIAVSQPAAHGAQCRGATNVCVHLLGAELVGDGSYATVWPDGTMIRLMTLSRFVAFKNLGSLVDAVASVAPRMRAERAHLAMVGSGPLRSEIASTILHRSVADIVSMHDYVPNPAGQTVA